MNVSSITKSNWSFIFISSCNLIQFISTHVRKERKKNASAAKRAGIAVFTKRFVKTCLNHKDDPWSDKWYAIIDTDSAD